MLDEFHSTRSERGGLICHDCGAPLTVLPDSPYSVCACCEAENLVLDLELPSRFEAETRQARSLDALIKPRLRSLRLWRLLSALAGCLVLTGMTLLAAPLGRAWNSTAPRHAPINHPWSYKGPTAEGRH